MSTTTEYLSEITASDATVVNMEQYGKYTILEALPNCIDGLRLIHRRILVTIGCSSDRIKGAAVVGDCMHRYHPHGDTGIYDALIRLAQPFNQMMPMVLSEGNVGAYGGGKPAASRYLDVMSAEFARDVFFNNTNDKTLVYIPCETGKGYEPAYLIPVIPMSLLTGSQGIAIGFRSQLPILNLNSVCDLVLKYINLKKHTFSDATTAYKEYARYLVPDYPVSGLILNERELINAYGEGKFDTSLVTSGVMEIYPNKINIRTVPYGNDFTRCVKMPLGELTRKASFVTEHFTEVLDLTTGKMMGDVELPLKRGVDPFRVLSTLKRTIKFVAYRSHIWNFCNHEGQLLMMDPISLLDMWYKVRSNSIISSLKQTNVDLFNEYRELTALVVVADHTDKVLSIFKKADSAAATIEPLCKAFGLTQYQAKFLSKLQMQQITRQGKDELIAKVEDVKRRLDDLQHQFGRVDEIIAEQVSAIQKKYGKLCPRRTKFSRFSCCLVIKGSGMIQAENLEELSTLVGRWESRDIEIIVYPKGSHKVVPYVKGIPYGGIPLAMQKYDLQKEMTCDTVKIISRTQHTVVINRTDGTAYRMDGTQLATDPKLECYFVSDEFTSVTKDGKVRTMRYSDIPKRNTFNVTGVKSDLIYISANVDNGEGLVLVTMNTNEPNVVTLELVHDGSKYSRMLMGTTYYAGLFRLDDYMGMTCYAECLNRCSVKHIFIKSFRPLMTANLVKIHLNRKHVSTGGTLTPVLKSSKIFQI